MEKRISTDLAQDCNTTSCQIFKLSQYSPSSSTSSNTTTSSSDATSNSYETTTELSDEERHQQDLLEVVPAICEALHIRPTKQIGTMIYDKLCLGMEKKLIYSALDETLLAPLPSIRYLLAILAHCYEEGCLTYIDWCHRQREHERKVGRDWLPF